MPLFKKRPFVLADTPTDLRPDEHVFQVPFTKEIFRSYEDYLKRMNLYRQRLWVCQVTGKVDLTYEEALISEHKATKKCLRFPVEYKASVLQLVQFSMLSLNNLVKMIFERLKENYLEGEELQGTLENSERQCKILKVIASAKNCFYRVGWLDEEGNVMDTSIEDCRNFNRLKQPFSRHLLKLFIRCSTSQSSPWVLDEELAAKYGISTVAPENLKVMIEDSKSKNCSYMDLEPTSDKRKKALLINDASGVTKKAKTAPEVNELNIEENKVKKKIKYPIEDSLLEQSPNDAILPERPKPSTSFVVPMEIVGALLMVWDFCLSFGRLLHLSPFSLEEFESAIVCEGVSNLIAEIHWAILIRLVKDGGEFNDLIGQKNRKAKVTTTNWEEYLCDFLELKKGSCSNVDVSKIKRGLYYKISVPVKLEILSILVDCVLSTIAIREQLDQYISKREALLAAKREKELEERKKQKEEKELNEVNLTDKKNSELHGENKEANDLHQSDKINLAKSDMDVKNAENEKGKKARKAELKKLRAQRAMKKKLLKKERIKKQQEDYLKRELEKYFIRTTPVGKDRDYNRYWYFQRGGRLFVENADHKQWGYYTSKEELDQLMSSLNTKGQREMALKKQLQKLYVKISSSLQKRSNELLKSKAMLDTAVLRRSIRVSVPPKDSYINKWR